MAEPAEAEHGNDLPGRAPLLRSALNVVMPAHISGAASTEDRSSGTRARAVAGAIMYSA